MRRRTYLGFLVVEGLVCIIFELLHMQFSNVFSSIVAFPFEQIGVLLRRLSLSGKIGNVIAFLIYFLVCLIPCFAYLMMKKKHRTCREDFVLPAMSVMLLIVIYYMINPGLLHVSVPGTGKWMLGACFYSVLFGYLILRVISAAVSADTKRLQKMIIVLLAGINIAFIYAICSQQFGSLLTSIMELRNANTASGFEFDMGSTVSGLEFTYLLFVVQFLADALPYALDIVIVFLAMQVIHELEEDRYSDQAIHATEKLAGFCVKALKATVVVSIAVNILQLIYCDVFYQINITITIPIVSIAFVLIILLYTRYVREDQKLKQENDSFI